MLPCLCQARTVHDSVMICVCCVCDVCVCACCVLCVCTWLCVLCMPMYVPRCVEERM